MLLKYKSISSVTPNKSGPIPIRQNKNINTARVIVFDLFSTLNR